MPNSGDFNCSCLLILTFECWIKNFKLCCLAQFYSTVSILLRRSSIFLNLIRFNLIFIFNNRLTSCILINLKITFPIDFRQVAVILVWWFLIIDHQWVLTFSNFFNWYPLILFLKNNWLSELAVSFLCDIVVIETAKPRQLLKSA